MLNHKVKVKVCEDVDGTWAIFFEAKEKHPGSLFGEKFYLGKMGTLEEVMEVVKVLEQKGLVDEVKVMYW